MKVLFICKKNEIPSFLTYTRRSSGLYNSTSFIVRSLCSAGIGAKLIEVHDNNDIDREVTAFRPDVVIIEALWVVPEKFPILSKLHPTVKWFVHLHSHMPFLALEGIAMDWILRYAAQGVGLIANSFPSYKALLSILSEDELVYLPNVYLSEPRGSHRKNKDAIDVGCFGALRPLKNHLLQALAAIKFAKEKGRHLRFYVNGSRIETGGEPVLKNLRQLFEKQENAVLIEIPWHEPADFLDLLQTIDIGLQVSLTETFNVVTADYVTAGIPVVVSKEVSWVSNLCKAEDDDIDDIVRHMHRAWRWKPLVWLNQWYLRCHSNNAQFQWWKFICSLSPND